MNKYKYLISVIIPTRNRQIYAQAAVRHILGISKEIQIIVQDNSDNMSLRKDLEDLLNNEQIIYNYIGERIAGIDNYNIAASYAEGEFFCAIGDDDTVLPNIIDCAKWMKRNNIDAVKPSKDLVYWWPDSKNIRSKKRKYGFRQMYYTESIRRYERIVKGGWTRLFKFAYNWKLSWASQN